MFTFLLLLIAYLLGSIPTSIIAGKALRGIDVREHGSRNPGATNTFRVLGWKIGVAVGLIDILKGFLAVALLPSLVPADPWVSEEFRRILAGLAAVSGHVWTVFAGFRGGKGVGTAFGVFLGLAPIPSLAAAVVWSALTFGTGYVSVGSIAAAVALPATVIALGLWRNEFSPAVAVFSVIVGLLVIIRHRSNIGRLIRGEENRFGKRGRA
ncbi:MAG: glycerol-3-phosphate 1-O-acyltransferase PlsY [Candidatus Latescibacterota bacterium]